jgi:hypothetical protein
MQPFLLAASPIPPGAPPGRYWLETLAWAVPGTAVTRWLLLADVAIIGLVAARCRRPLLAGAIGVGLGFLVLNVLGLMVTDFFLGLALFHVLAGIVGIVATGRAWWSGVLLLGLALTLGVFT